MNTTSKLYGIEEDVETLASLLYDTIEAKWVDSTELMPENGIKIIILAKQISQQLEMDVSLPTLNEAYKLMVRKHRNNLEDMGYVINKFGSSGNLVVSSYSRKG